jgi:hypothetical protein
LDQRGFIKGDGDEWSIPLEDSAIMSDAIDNSGSGAAASAAPDVGGGSIGGDANVHAFDLRQSILEQIARKVWTGGYGERVAGENKILLRRKALNADVLRQHLGRSREDFSISVYLMEPGAETTGVAVIDIDDHEKRFTRNEIDTAAIGIMTVASNFGGTCNPVRSGGGHGIHLWMLWDKPHPIEDVSGLVAEIIHASGYNRDKSKTEFDYLNDNGLKVEQFPKRSTAVEHDRTDAPPIALPFARGSVPLDPKTLAELAQPALWVTCSEAPEKAAPRGKIPDSPRTRGWTAEIVADMLTHIEPSSRHQRTRVGMCMKHSTCPLTQAEAYDVWFEWLRKASGFERLKPKDTWDKKIRPRASGEGVKFATTIWMAQKGGWQLPLDLNEGKKKKVPTYLASINYIRDTPEWQDALAYNAFSSRPIFRKPYPTARFTKCPKDLEDSDVRAVWRLLQDAGIAVDGKGTVSEAMQCVAEESSFHPVLEYLNTPVWDNVARINTVLIDHLGAVDTPFNRVIGAKWMIGAVARVFQPGCLMKTVLLLEGPQDMGKSTAVRTLAVNPEWFTDHISDLSKKDSREETQGRWIVEFAEFVGMRKVEQDRLKAYISSPSDHFRPSYGTIARDFPRQWVGVITVNPGGTGMLGDETGAVRFWPVTCAVGWEVGRSVDAGALLKVRDQLWAEAVVRYRKGEEWWLSEVSMKVAQRNATDERAEDDPQEHTLREFLGVGLTERLWVQMQAVMLALGYEVNQQDRYLQIRLGQLMKRFGWQRWRGTSAGPNGPGYYYFPPHVKNLGEYAMQMRDKVEAVKAKDKVKVKAPDDELPF